MGTLDDWQQLVDEGRILIPKGQPYGTDLNSKWWGNPPNPELCVKIAPLNVPLEVEVKDENKSSFGPIASVVERFEIPLANVYARAYVYAVNNIPFGEFAVHFTLSRGTSKLGEFYANEWGWMLK